MLSDDYTKNKDTIIFLGNEKIAPVVYREKGIAKGVMVDIAEALGKKIGYKIRVDATDWEEAQKKVLSGEADALLQINPNPGREKLYDFSNEVLKSEFSIFIKSADNDIKTINDLKNANVGVESGGYPYLLLKKYNLINIVIIPSWRMGFQMIKSGEIDAVVVDRWIGEYELAQSKVKGIQVIDEPIETQYSRIAVKKGNEELLDLINAGLKELKDDGTMADILSSWQGKKVIYLTEEGIRNIVFYTTLGVFLFILLLSAYWINKFRRLNKKLESDVIEKTRELRDANERLLKANKSLEKISIIDELTNIYNKRYFEISLQKNWEICIREKLPLALIMLDVDGFKSFNDNHGHLAGDKCLKSLAGVIKSTIKRPGDLAARFGGDEFVILLFNTMEEGAAVVAERILRKIEKLGIENEAGGKVITVSLGVAAVIPDKRIKPEDLISITDKALYQAKEEGRNRVVRRSKMLN